MAAADSFIRGRPTTGATSRAVAFAQTIRREAGESGRHGSAFVVARVGDKGNRLFVRSCPSVGVHRRRSVGDAVGGSGGLILGAAGGAACGRSAFWIKASRSAIS